MVKVLLAGPRLFCTGMSVWLSWVGYGLTIIFIHLFVTVSFAELLCPIRVLTLGVAVLALKPHPCYP